MVPVREIIRDRYRLRGLLMAVAWFFLNIAMSQSLGEKQSLVNEGRVASATIRRNTRTMQKNGKVLNQYAYDFKDNRGRKTVGAARSAVHLYKIGQRVRVRYFPGSPGNNGIEAIERYDLQTVTKYTLPVSAAMLLILGLVLFLPVKPGRFATPRK